MNRTIHVVVVGAAVLAWLVVATGCSGTRTVQRSGGSNDTADFSKYDGVWEGTVTFARIGACQINGEDTLYIADTHVQWDVTAEGDVTGGEDHFYTAWSGKISADLGVELVKINDWSRGNGPSCVCVEYDTTEYASQIHSVAGGGYVLTLSSVESWCPASDCRFRVTYSLTKQ